MQMSSTLVLFSARSASLGWHLTEPAGFLSPPQRVPGARGQHHVLPLACGCPGSRARRLQTKTLATSLWPTPCRGVGGRGLPPSSIPQPSTRPLTGCMALGKLSGLFKYRDGYSVGDRKLASKARDAEPRAHPASVL